MSPCLLVFAIPLVAAVAGVLRRDAPRPDPLAPSGDAARPRWSPPDAYECPL